MLNSILSGDYPRSRLLTGLLILVVLGLAGGPFLWDGAVAYRTITLICLFIILVASYDILLGYTHIVSFAHTMFYGVGAYGVAIVLQEMPGSWAGVFLGTLAGLGVSIVLALLIGLFSLRVKAIFFALVTLAVATGFMILVSKFYHLTGGEDGLTLRVPRELGPAFKFIENSEGRVAQWYGFDIPTFFRAFFDSNVSFGDAVMKVRMSGKILMYYVVFIASAVLFLGMLRMMNSPFGRVLQAIRENEFRAEALGYRTMYYRTANVVVAAIMASLAGSLTALAIRYVNPDTTLSFVLMVNILLMCVIGGMGTLWGAVIGTALFVIAETYLQDFMGLGYGAVQNVPVVSEFINPDRWHLWFGLLFILSVYFFPKGIVGTLRARGERKTGVGKGANGEAAGETKPAEA
ncbi:branched-chain amino acid ABC transporter permease [Alkalilimnicola sp. S0819]|uniref:branched-chain amino acid ABC transporter permease n=1 Tax=Alkalilimnicola sp. S0819 TaxID=2613922 RepID=UPI001261E316|nr:branched-chain amino acid ABC transporter permease [Alkalilimnicola sp. S0819]KAB7628297.1 branched-chain amino acid ABC transporter permease [Alkalilimnicola sp. S0819]MPQ15194.1 branched-chain amino acid ABC transporter permease [Alkalilimnicola sp. S0819]